MVVGCSSVLFCNKEKTGRWNVKGNVCDNVSVLVLFVLSEKMLRDGNIELFIVVVGSENVGWVMT